MKARTILVIEDEADLRELLSLHLSDLGFAVQSAADGADGYAIACASADFDLIVLDLGLPGMDGLEICRRLQARDSQVPILMLTARNSETDRVVGLEMGADDYLTKPFSVRELQARVKAILRRIDRTARPDAEALEFGDLAINATGRTVSIKGLHIELTSTEFDLLLHLARHPGQVFSRAQLLDQVWGYQHSGYEHTVNSHINRLRTKIETDPSKPRFVLTVWGVGYKFGGAS